MKGLVSFSVCLIVATVMMASFHQTEGISPIEVNEENWEHLLDNGEWMVEFYAPWCPACKRFEATWAQFADKANQLDIRVGAADVNANPVLSGLFSVTSLPTIYHIKDGKYRIYSQGRDLSKLTAFIANKEWKSIEPSSAWLAPNSFLIKIMSVLFKLTIYFKDFYTDLTENQGYPIWAVLTLFVVLTVTSGLIIGVIFVLIIDCCCSSTRNGSKQAAYQDQFNNSQEDDDIHDDSVAPQLVKNEDSSATTSAGGTKVQKRRAKKDL